MKKMINFRVNGVEEIVYVEPWWSLAQVLREELALTGLKVACNEGDCGACTVLVDGKAVKSCLYNALKAKGKDILTIEGLKGEDGDLHPLQKAFIKHSAVQCGYCTSGMILTAKALLDENPNPTKDEIKNYLIGNLCRCTGYTKIFSAIQEVANSGNKEELSK